MLLILCLLSSTGLAFWSAVSHNKFLYWESGIPFFGVNRKFGKRQIMRGNLLQAVAQTNLQRELQGEKMKFQERKNHYQEQVLSDISKRNIGHSTRVVM
ncbi:hypothetical protein Y1Q_0002358 [Alligator mississippiensis]|uniref:Uncharacterized protein n=1 Tax=Alligator mississippiensis TaxID=8496 RepID=A0A151MGU0_ALLMI|nr:hypothetical protein Y1Q_0002358 [Alligator mississippiensis]